MPDELLSIDSIEIVGGVNSINLSIDRGAEGQRGSYIIPWLGNPNTVQFPVILNPQSGPVYPQPLDWYINLNTQDEDYLCVYQLKINGSWEFIFKLIPNVYNTNEIVSFTSGIAMVIATVSEESLVLSQIYGVMDIPDLSEEVDSEAEMYALSGLTIDDYAYRTDTSSFYRVLSLPADSASSWEKELTINLGLDFQNPYPIASNFTINKPYTTVVSGKKYYNFPIMIFAAEANPVSGWGAASGVKEAHLGISVI